MKLFSVLILVITVFPTAAQTYFDGKFRITSYTHEGYKYRLYAFSRQNYQMKAKYFAQNAYSQYVNWKSGKNILLVTSGAFSDSFEADAKPVGLCVDNGAVVNKIPEEAMDGMVIVYNGGAEEGGVVVVDMDVNYVQVQNSDGNMVNYDPRESATDRINFLNWGQVRGLTLFQTQLVYSKDRKENFGNLSYGKVRERRFLALCRKDEITYHVVVDAPDDLELNRSASYAKEVLEFDGFLLLYLLNLDTGDKNILYAFNGEQLVNLEPFKGLTENRDRARIQNATNLLVYYTD